MELTRDVFNPLEEAIHSPLFPALFAVPQIPEDLCDLAALPVQHGGLGAPNPTEEAPRNRSASKECTNHLMEASLGEKRKEEEYEHERKGIETFYTEDHCCSVERAGKVMNNWLTVVLRTANNSILNKEEFRDQ
eukprot:11939123-Ditylum_brightwellii.AAC.1